MSGVPGGAGVSENSAAREVRGVCFVERATRRLVLLSKRVTRDWGVISFAKAGNMLVVSGQLKANGRTFRLRCEEDYM